VVLVMHTRQGRIEQRIGASWEVDATNGAHRPVASRFLVLEPSDGRLRFGFEAPGRDPARAFVLDPSLVYATYVGGASQELLKDMHVDPAGAVYLTCRSPFGSPTTPGAYQGTPPGVYDVWVGKLSPDGKTLQWGTYLGGSDVEEPFGIDVDQNGTVVVMGNTWSSDFPTTAGSLQPSYGSSATMKSDSRLGVSSRRSLQQGNHRQRVRRRLHHDELGRRLDPGLPSRGDSRRRVRALPETLQPQPRTLGVNWSPVTVTGGSGETFFDVATWDDGTPAILVGQNGGVFEKTGTAFVKQTLGLTVTEHLNDVEVLNSGSNVRICGQNGVVLFRDSGTWTKPKSQTNDPLYRLVFQSPTHGFGVGQQFVLVEYK
jgi:hypothetical protein